MKSILPMKNTIQEYAWGSHTAIADLLGLPVPSKQPQAELWMGAHPKAPSMVAVNADWHPLNQLIAESPDEFIGHSTAMRFGSRLPYLFKILASARPLSIQAHPNLEQAREGFDRENREGIALDAPNRNYRDDNHKPEILCAVTPFWALCGFRPIDEMLSLFSQLEITGLKAQIHDLAAHPGPDGLHRCFESLMGLDTERKSRVTAQAVEKARRLVDQDPVFQWITELNDAYPGDIGVLSPVLLNLIELQPGQAISLSAGELHTYLEGTGIELMANSDNVLRGGLTSKHMDVPELIKVLTYTPRRVSVLEPRQVRETEERYRTIADEFTLSRITLKPGGIHSSEEIRSTEILLCMAGKVTIVGDAEDTSVSKGMSVLVQAAAAPYIIKGEGVLYKAAVPL